MNYIKALQLKVKEAEDSQEKVTETINLLHAYLNSSKFNCGDALDGYVNISDVRVYLDRMKGAMI